MVQAFKTHESLGGHFHLNHHIPFLGPRGLESYNTKWIRSNFKSPHSQVSTLFKNLKVFSETRGNLLIVTPCKVKRQMTHFQHNNGTEYTSPFQKVGKGR